MNKDISRFFLFRPSTLKIFFLLGTFLLVASACTLGGSSSPEGGSQATTAAPEAPASARDVNSLDACALFPEDAVASALNVTKADPANPGKGFGGPSCTYFLLPAGAGTNGGQIYILNLIPAELFDPSLNALVNSQPLSGLGDQAFIGTRVGSSSIDLMVLKAGDLGIEVLGEDTTLVQKLAEYVLANLP
jgi:hypothetical protein